MSSVSKAADYSVVERLRDGSEIEIRALRPADQQEMLAAVGRTSVQSLQRRFFVPKRHFSDKELDFFMNVDFKNHMALVAEIDENGRRVIVGGGRYIMVQPGQAEMAFAVVDAYQGKGIGAVLMRHLVAIARDGGLKKLIAEVLPENAAMLKADLASVPLPARTFKSSTLPCSLLEWKSSRRLFLLRCMSQQLGPLATCRPR
jgi:RimJ/RimL family protein N-acetyltransferase